MKKRVILILVALTSAIPAAGAGQSPCPVHLVRTAVSELPAERVIVFDPVSESFAFVRSVRYDCLKDDPAFMANQEFMDIVGSHLRHRK
jgi:hypothetical protein